jgi:hypothetical protein
VGGGGAPGEGRAGGGRWAPAELGGGVGLQVAAGHPSPALSWRKAEFCRAPMALAVPDQRSELGNSRQATSRWEESVPSPPRPTPVQLGSWALRSMKLSSDRLVFVGCLPAACGSPPWGLCPPELPGIAGAPARAHRGPANPPASWRVSERGDPAGWAAAARAWALSAVERAAWGRTFAQLRVPEPPALGEPCWREGACTRWGGGEPH